MSPEPWLQTNNLRSGYGGKPVLQGVNFTLNKSEVIAVIGRNGAGKSTLMKTLIGLLAAQQGEIQFCGKKIQNLACHRRARLGLGYVPQGRDVFPRMTVAENLAVSRIVASASAAHSLTEIFSLFPVLKERQKQKAGTMSGGQQQQLAIGRALLTNPSLLLLDEPSEGIQPSVVQEIGRTILHLNQTTGLTVMLVEQNMSMITAVAQRGYVMDKGRVIIELSREELQDRNRLRTYLSV
jgi:branched-chain amino acid transport system ATP-binding protein